MSYPNTLTAQTIILHIIASQDRDIDDCDLCLLLDKHCVYYISDEQYKSAIIDLQKAGLINVNRMVLEDANGKTITKMYSIRKCK